MRGRKFGHGIPALFLPVPLSKMGNLIPTLESNDAEWENIEDFEVMQYTGLKDRNDWLGSEEK